MKTANRARAGPRRGLALLATALLLTGTIVTPAFGETDAPAANPCQVGATYAEKEDVSPDNAVVSRTVTYDGADVGTLTANEPLGTVTVALDEGYTLDLCVFGGTERQEYWGVGDGFVSDPLSTPSEQGTTAGVSNFAWRVIPPEPELDFFVSFTKDWAGDADGLGDANVTFLVDGEQVAVGANHPVELGQTLTLDEEVTGLGDCSYSSDLPATYDVPTGEYDDGHVFTIEVTNTVTCDEEPADGSVTIAKEVTGDGDAPDAPFTFTVTDGNGIDQSVDVAAGATSSPIEVPADSSVTITETIDHDADATTWTATDTTSGDGTTATLAIGEDEHLTITFTNRFDAELPPPVDDQHGDLVVTKVVEGDAAPPEASFTVAITCTYEDMEFGWTDDIGHGESMGPFRNLPAGSECTITETDVGGADTTTVDGEAGTTATVTIEADAEHEVEIVNTFAPDVLDEIDEDIDEDTDDPVRDVDVPEETREVVEVGAEVIVRRERDTEPEVEVLAEVLERGELPRTGADARQLIVLGALLFLLGGALLRRPIPIRQR